MKSKFLEIMDCFKEKTSVPIDLNDLEDIQSIEIEVISGDEICTVQYKNGKTEEFDSSDTRCLNFYDGKYILYDVVSKTNIINKFITRQNSYSMLDSIEGKEKMRKFEKISSIKEDIKLPERSTSKSAGYDFYVPEDVICKAHQITLVKTGVKAYFPADETLLLFNRSSNPKKKGLIILNGVGVVDSDYADNQDNEGEIGGLFYNMLDEDVTLKAGEKIMQGIFMNFAITDDDNAEGERTGGFGSTGK